MQVMQAAFGGSVSSLYSQQLQLSVAQPSDGCSPLQNAADVNGTIVLIQRGTCYVSTKVWPLVPCCHCCVLHSPRWIDSIAWAGMLECFHN